MTRWLLITAIGFLTVSEANTDPNVWDAVCFEESERYGRVDVLDSLEKPVSDRSQLNNIARTAFGKESRVAFMRYCTDPFTDYLESV